MHNPYYAFIALRFCNYDHSFKITFQYCLWDFLRECGENDVGGMELIKNTPIKSEVKEVPLRKLVNMAKLYATLISERELSIAILKVRIIAIDYRSDRLIYSTHFTQFI